MNTQEDLLIEIGCEEIPASYILPALEDMKAAFEKFCADNSIGHGALETCATPRRLTLIVRGVHARQQDSVLEVKGPPARAARDENGAWTKAATGFAESRGASLKDLQIRDTGKGEYLFIVKKQKGRPTAKLLPDLLQAVVSGIHFSKSMRWGAYKMRFARPVRWIVFLFGDKAVTARIDTVTSGRYSMGHHFTHNKKVKIPSVADYFRLMEENHVLADHDERRTRIADAVRAAAQGRPLISDELLNDILFLVEYPHVGVGAFDEQFLKLPREVLLLCIEKTQHYFPIENETGDLLPRFCVVMNMPLEDSADVISGYQKVLHSRLKDALFFYLNDMKEPLEERVPRLDRIVFQKELGTLLDKTNRLRALCERLCGHLGLNAGDCAAADRAALLCKADLTTSMVFEFTELQGIVGRHYALRGGEPSDVALAIDEHYMPRFADDDLPATTPGRVLAVADKADTICGYFTVGLIPSGSEDPFSMRRQGLGLLRILEDSLLPIRVEDIFSMCLEAYGPDLAPPDKRQALLAQLMEFMDVRFRTLLESRGLAYDIVNAVSLRQAPGMPHAVACAQALAALRPDPVFQDLLEVFTRVSNIMKKSASGEDFKGDSVSEELLAEESERRLFEEYGRIRSSWNGAGPAAREDYEERIRDLFAITPLAHAFFDNVMVMAEDRAVRANRLALLSRLRALYLEVADFGAIVKG